MMSSGLLPSELSDDVLKCVICAGTLESPVLLNCLHSACMSCICDRTGHVMCPVCRVTTDTAAAAGKTNLLVSSLGHRSRVMKSMFSCAHCIDEDKLDATAVVWCYTCQQPLCADFQKYHNRLYPIHKLIYLTENTVLSELYRPPLRCCTKHGEELRFACFTCCDGCCIKCAHCCYTSSHDIQPLEGPAAVERISDRVTRASSLLSDLRAINVLLQSHLTLSEKFASAREESLTKLRNAKKTVMDSISRAYINAEKSLLECWDTVTSKSFHSLEAVEILTRRLEWTHNYCHMAINSDDVVGLLPQLDAMSLSLSNLLDEARRVKEPVDPIKTVSISICLPCDLDLITDGWFGMAKVVSEDLNCSVNESPAEHGSDNYTVTASPDKEAESLLETQSEYHKHVQRDDAVVQLTGEQLLAWTSTAAENQLDRRTASDNEAVNHLEMQIQHHKRLQHESRVVQLPSEQLLVSPDNEACSLIEARTSPRNEAGSPHEKRSDSHEYHQRERRVVQPPNEHFLAFSGNEACSLHETRSEHHEHVLPEKPAVQPPSEQFFGNDAGIQLEKRNEHYVTPSMPLFASSGVEAERVAHERNDYHEQFQRENWVATLPSEPLFVFSDNEACSLHETRSEHREHVLREKPAVQPPSEQFFGHDAGIQLERRNYHNIHAQHADRVVQLPSEPLFAPSGNETEHVAHERNEYHEQFQCENRVASLPSELLFALPMTFSAFKGPGKCWDVAVTPQGRLLVAATSDGLKEYDATNFREITTWKPGYDLIGEHTTTWVSTVDALADGRAVVGLFFSKQVVLLQRFIDGDKEYWHGVLRVAELQGPPRRLSAFADQLLAVIEDRYDEETQSWRPGSVVALFSLSNGMMQRRIELDYNACSVALTDRIVVVTSNDAMELLENDSIGGHSKKSYVVDCFSHTRERLWRRIGLKVMSVCTDSVGRVLYAAQSPGSIVVLDVDDGRELRTTVRTKDTEQSYAIGLDKTTQRILVLLSLDGDEPNVVTIFRLK